MDYAPLIEKRRQRLDELDQAISSPEFYNDPKKAGTFTGGKVVEVQNKAKALREHLAKHEKEYTDLEAELGRVEADLK